MMTSLLDYSHVGAGFNGGVRGFIFAGAFQLNLGDDPLASRAQLAVPVPANVPAGSTKSKR